MANHVEMRFRLATVLEAQEALWDYMLYQSWLISQETLPKIFVKPLPDPESELLLITLLQKKDDTVYPFWPHKDPPKPEYMTKREMIATAREVCQKNLNYLDQIEKELLPDVEQVG